MEPKWDNLHAAVRQILVELAFDGTLHSDLQDRLIAEWYEKRSDYIEKVAEDCASGEGTGGRAR